MRRSCSNTEPATIQPVDVRQGMVFDVKRFAIHDGPGIRTTVFLKGCPLHCAWCHNPESQSSRPEILFAAEHCIGCRLCVPVCPEGAITVVHSKAVTDRSLCTGCGRCVQACPTKARTLVGTLRIVDDLLALIERDALFFDQSGGGVTLSGGEPLEQPEFSAELLRRCREQRIHTAVDTSGFSDESVLRRIANYTDLFLYDVKLVDEDRHVAATGVSNRNILRNLRLLSEHGAAIRVRYPLIPGVNDSPADLADVADLVAALPHVESMQVLPYHRAGEQKLRHLERPTTAYTAEVPTPASVEHAVRVIRNRVSIPVTLGG